ncbi:MAG: DUF2157 domain-containing protein [Saprospiraceae bacterium]|nr:DUF2157 domain-containing protein [Saprospiraceae bacterium]
MKLSRQDINIIVKNSNLNSQQIQDLINDEIKPDQNSWKVFISRALLLLGLAFVVAGIFFFFAYNWDGLHKFVKLGIIASLIVASTLFSIRSNVNDLVKKILVSFAALMVGAFFAVFGQIYQTGASAYQLFLAWTILIVIWCFAVDFEILWLIFVALVHLTFGLYYEQAVDKNDPVLFFCIHTIISSVFIIVFYKYKFSKPEWFFKILFFVLLGFVSVGAALSFGSNSKFIIPISLEYFIIFYFVGRHGIVKKDIYYLALLLISVQIVVSSFLLNISTDVGMFFAICIFVLAASIGGIYSMKKLIKSWNE